MNRNMFYFLLLVLTCLIRFTIIFEIIIVSILIIIFLSSTILDHRGASDALTNMEEGENPQLEEVDFESKKGDFKEEENEYNQEYFIHNSNVDDKITKLGRNKKSTITFNKI